MFSAVGLPVLAAEPVFSIEAVNGSISEASARDVPNRLNVLLSQHDLEAQLGSVRVIASESTVPSGSLRVFIHTSTTWASSATSA